MRAVLLTGFVALATMGCKDPGAKVTPATVDSASV